MFQIETMHALSESWECDEREFPSAGAAVDVIQREDMAHIFAAVGVRDLDDPFGPFVYLDTRPPGPPKPPRRTAETEEWK